jgi:anti-anti-sigma factor
VRDGQLAIEIHTCLVADRATAVIRVGGEIDVATAPVLQEVILRHIQRHQNAIADLADVTFMDASGVGILIQAEATARSCGVQLTVARPTGLVARVLRLTGADEILDIRTHFPSSS